MVTSSTNDLADEARGQFREGKYREALETFKDCARRERGSDESFRAKMLGNAVQCCLKMNETKEAVLLSLQCLQLDPFNPKVHYRMSAAYSLSNLRLAFKHICICVGLQTTSGKQDIVSKKQLELLKRRMALEFPDDIHILPDDASKVVVVSSVNGLQSALRSKMQVVILKPGKYHLVETIRTIFLGHGSINPMMMMMVGDAPLQKSKLWLLGLAPGTHIVKPSNMNMGHVISCEFDSSTVVVENVRIIDDTMQRNGASFVVAGTDNKMAIKNCTIAKGGDNPVLCADGALVHVIDSCFENMPTASGVEIRERGRGKISGCTLKNLRQGVIAYAGAQDVHISDCIVENTLAEGFLFDGSKHNASTRAQKPGHMDYIPFDVKAREVSRQASDLALRKKWGGQLNVTMESCTSKNIGSFGATCDHGALVQIKGCVFDSCQMYGVFIKGETDVDICFTAFLNHRKSAVVQAINYGGIVNLNNVVFFKNKADVVDEMSEASRQQRQLARASNMFSMPIVKNNIMNVNARQAVPDAEALMISSKSTAESLTVQPRTEKVIPPISAAAFVPCRGGFQQSQPSYYAIGNTAGHDVLKDCKKSNACTDVLFAACGDVRNVVETATNWWRTHRDDSGTLRITLNDQSASILARDLILLELFRTASPRSVTEAWACLGVKPHVKEQIVQVMTSLQLLLATGSKQDDLDRSFPFFLARDGNKAIQPVLSAWLKSSLEMKDVRRDLDLMTLLKAEELSQGATADTASKRNPVTTRQIKNYLRTLSVGSKATALNITMLEAPTLSISALYWSSSIYRATNSAEPFVFIEDRVDAMKCALNSGRVQINVICCDVLAIPEAYGIKCDGGKGNEKPFDDVDFTNVADYVGLSTVLGLGSLLAKRMIHVQQMRWNRAAGNDDMKRYLAECLGLKCGDKIFGLNMFKHLSGLSLKCHHIRKDVLNTTWEVEDHNFDERKTVPEHQFIKIAANYCKVLPHPTSDGCGKIMPETLGLLRSGKWLSLYGKKLQSEYPLYCDCIQVSQDKNASIVCKIDSPTIDYLKFLTNTCGYDNMVASVLVVNKREFEKDAAVLKTLPQLDTDGSAKSSESVGFLPEAASSFLMSIILHVQCDFEESILYLAVPSDFLSKYGVSKHALLYVIEHPEHGFVPLTPLISFSHAVQV